MNAATTAKVLRRRSLAVVDQLSYVPIARLTFTIMLNVLVSQQLRGWCWYCTAVVT